MKVTPPKNLIASIRQRLLNISREKKETHELTLTRYASERLLYRLSLSIYREKFVLKGAQLFAVWTGQVYRPTPDLDFLGFEEASIEHLQKVFKELCAFSVQPEDGLAFDPQSIKINEIREDQEYGGMRVNLNAHLGQAKIPLQVDVGYGDAITPDAIDRDFPTLLDQPAPRLRTYPVETVIAEKLEAMVSLGIANSRMKDFYDLLVISQSQSFELDGSILMDAVNATFKRRGTAVPTDTPFALTAEFAEDDGKRTQWRAFLRRAGLPTTKSLEDVITILRDFLGPLLSALQLENAPPGTWVPKAGWQKTN